MKVNSVIDFKKEAIDLIYKIYSPTDIDGELKDELINDGINIEVVNNLFINYDELKSNFKKELIISPNLIPYFTMSLNSTSILKRFYIKHKYSNIDDYMIFLNRFFEIDLLLKETFSEKLEFNDILSIINLLDVDDKDKLTLINFYHGGLDLYNEIVATIEIAAKVFEKYYVSLEKEVVEIYKKITSNGILKDYFKDYFEGKEVYGNNIEIILGIVEYNYISYIYVNNKHYIYIGYLAIELDSLIKLHYNDEKETLNAIKIISDPTRYKILKILTNKKTYGNDLANILGLSAATINHHLNQLTSIQILKLSFDSDDNKKIYYELNKQKLDQILSTFRRNLL